jgi:thiosulfate/3-mercaptopyruvate sulfurtransferase
MNTHNSNLKTRDILSYWLALLAAIIFISLSQCVNAADNPAGNSEGNLVNTEWLQKNLADGDLILLDASPNKMYAEKHITGAVNVNAYALGVMETPVAVMEQLIQALGISPGKTVVIYDQGGAILATRVFFSLYYHGYPAENLYILDGGLSKWTEKGFAVTGDVPAPLPKGTFTVNERNEEARVMLDEFLTSSGDLKNNVLLEALGADWHFGKNNFFDRSGHIPNAVMLPSEDFFNGDKTFKSPEEIKKMLDYYGIHSGQKVLTHCGGGVSASVPFFVLKFMMNYPKVKLYMESQMGWLSDERGLPMWTYDSPLLMRETRWLQTWGGKMLRMYGIAQVSIVDIRTEAEYNNVHLPFSVNIPAEVFRNNINSTDKLAEILGKAGVDIKHEAVIVSGAGLTKETAIVFATLEKLGQKKVSIFMDTFEKAGELGFAPVTDSSAFKPVKYPLNLNKDVLISAGENNKGIYPAIYIASGGNTPSKIPKGKVVNIQYTEFLNCDGTPKNAKDIWDIITNSGVTRYAEIVCMSDDPGESAVNYFIFKLMGFPDVKIKV